MDGADWLQGFADWHRRDALRILDFPHAGSYVAKIGQATWGADTPELAGWLTTQLHQLKHTGPQAVLATLRDMVAEQPQAETLELPKALAYLEKRQAQMDYPAFQAHGWPIASGATESGNKLVVEARLKGAGMHWARPKVDPMLALRNVACNDRWDETWRQIEAHLRQQVRDQRAARRARRAEAVNRPTSTHDSAPIPMPEPAPPPLAEVMNEPPPTDATPAPRRPAANHPWRRSFLRQPTKSRLAPHRSVQ